MSELTLWRVDVAAPLDTDALARLASGLTLHLHHAAIVSAVAGVGGRQQSYLLTQGCSGCASERCVPGCRARLLQRLMRACGLAAEMRVVSRGLARQRYTRAALAWPDAAAETLDTSFVSRWPEARLALSWHAWRRTIRLGALLLVGGEGPDPARELHGCGWRSVKLPPALPLITDQLDSVMFVPRAVWRGLPYLLFRTAPTLATATIPPAAPPVGDVQAVFQPDEQSLGVRALLQRLELEAAQAPDLARCELAEAACQEVRPTPDRGALPLTLAQTRALLEQIVANPRLTTGRQQSQIGLTAGRLNRELHIPRADAAALIAWFDRAGVVAEPFCPEQRWSAPRQLTSFDIDQLAARLHATPAANEMSEHYGTTFE
jgi:hypothetical protein